MHTQPQDTVCVCVYNKIALISNVQIAIIFGNLLCFLFLFVSFCFAVVFSFCHHRRSMSHSTATHNSLVLCKKSQYLVAVFAKYYYSSLCQCQNSYMDVILQVKSFSSLLSLRKTKLSSNQGASVVENVLNCKICRKYR